MHMHQINDSRPRIRVDGKNEVTVDRFVTIESLVGMAGAVGKLCKADRAATAAQLAIATGDAIASARDPRLNDLAVETADLLIAALIQANLGGVTSPALLDALHQRLEQQAGDAIAKALGKTLSDMGLEGFVATA